MKPKLQPEPIRTFLAPRRTPRLVTLAPTPILDDASGIEAVQNTMPKMRPVEAVLTAIVLFAILFTADLCARVLLAAFTQP